MKSFWILKEKIDNKLSVIGKKIKQNRCLSKVFSANWYAQSGLGQISRVIPNTAQWMGFVYLIEKFTEITISTLGFVILIPVVAFTSLVIGYLWKKMGFQDNEREATNRIDVVSDAQYKAAKLILKRLKKSGNKL